MLLKESTKEKEKRTVGNMFFTEKYLKRCQFIRSNGRQCRRKGRILCSNGGWYCKQHAKKGEVTRIEGATKGSMTAAGPYERLNKVQAPNVAASQFMGEVKKQIDPELARVFQHYENSFGGLITPLIADEIKYTLSHYHASWIIEAIDVACKAEKRSWAYVTLILERWHTNGKN